MPHSRWANKKIIAKWIDKLQLPRERILDLGAGMGTYHILLTDKYTTALKDSHWIAVEVWEPYIEEFKLHEMYAEVYVEDIRIFDYSKVAPVDLTFMGDVLEHMTKEEAQEVVAKVLEVSRYAAISIPVMHWKQDALYGNPYEKHIKEDWSHTEVMNSFPHIIEGEDYDGVGVYLLEGGVA
jgi:cyclopropane fatty-acyl-phospholipid synthase-like methyltransferase